MNDQTPDNQTLESRIRSGEYFREAHNWYSGLAHDPMTERYFYIFITIIAVIIFFISFISIQMLYPLKSTAPFIVRSMDMMEDLPRIRPLARKGEDPNAAVVRFLLRHYVSLREEYDVKLVDRNDLGVRGHSSPEVYAEYERYIDPKNPESPVTLYQRHAVRDVQVLEIRGLSLRTGEAEVVFRATVDNKPDQTSQWIANISFTYKNIALDEVTGKPAPLQFIVTRYRTKRLQDIQ
jgi:type IV secretory pathway component VirB8